MGADGGICWVGVKDREKFKTLVRPFGYARWDDYHDEAHDLWLEENGKDPEFVYGTYGTGQNICLLALEETLRHFQWYIENSDYWELCADWVHLTFEEMLIELQTRSDWTLGYRTYPSALETAVYSLRFRDPFDDPVLQMTGREWTEQILEVIDPNSFGSEETWT